jgi:hypothetical protein
VLKSSWQLYEGKPLINGDLRIEGNAAKEIEGFYNLLYIGEGPGGGSLIITDSPSAEALSRTVGPFQKAAPSTFQSLESVKGNLEITRNGFLAGGLLRTALDER